MTTANHFPLLRWRVVMLTIGFLGATGSLQAAYFDGFFALDTGDYDTAYDEWRASAQTGDAKSMTGLGLLYEDGLGVEQDDVMAHAYYEMASRLGDPDAPDKRDSIERRLQADDRAASDAIIAEVRRSGRLPPKTRIEAQTDSVAEPVVGTPPAAVTSGVEPDTAPPQSDVEVAGTTSSTATSVAQPATMTRAPGIEVGQVCDFGLRWADRGSGGNRDIALYEPEVPKGFWSLGSHGRGNYKPATGCATVVKPLNPELVRAPKSWELIWWDKGSGARMDGSIWAAVPPASDYVCLGAVAQQGYSAPQPTRYGCVHRCMVKSRKLKPSLWDDRGTGADKPVTIHRLPKSKVIVAFAGRNAPLMVDDLNLGAACITGG